MKTNVRLARQIPTSRGPVDVYILSAERGGLGLLRGWAADNGENVSVYVTPEEFDKLPVITLDVNPAMVPYVCERGHRTNEVSGSGPVLAWCCSEDIGGWCGDDEYVACNKPLMQVCD